eukprot:GILK01007340.1.p1 GENE.GILK01007340.1~~GILK01007340.1.p1  ORF type:complete len:450 (-),score=108.81 GILK01007340.1:232-1581(-)
MIRTRTSHNNNKKKKKKNNKKKKNKQQPIAQTEANQVFENKAQEDIVEDPIVAPTLPVKRRASDGPTPEIAGASSPDFPTAKLTVPTLPSMPLLGNELWSQERQQLLADIERLKQEKCELEVELKVETMQRLAFDQMKQEREMLVQQVQQLNADLKAIREEPEEAVEKAELSPSKLLQAELEQLRHENVELLKEKAIKQAASSSPDASHQADLIVALQSELAAIRKDLERCQKENKELKDELELTQENYEKLSEDFFFLENKNEIRQSPALSVVLSSLDQLEQCVMGWRARLDAVDPKTIFHAKVGRRTSSVDTNNANGETVNGDDSVFESPVEESYENAPEVSDILNDVSVLAEYSNDRIDALLKGYANLLSSSAQVDLLPAVTPFSTEFRADDPPERPEDWNAIFPRLHRLFVLLLNDIAASRKSNNQLSTVIHRQQRLLADDYANK